MISAGKLTPGHAQYFEGEVALGREDYYAGRGESPGVWKGTGAQVAGLEGQVLEGQLATLFELRHPVTGAELGAPYRVSGTWVDRFGNEQIRHKRAAFDATFSVPKSVSELYAQTDPATQARVVAAAQCGVDAAIGHLETHAAFSRTGRGGPAQVDTEGLVVAQFMHRTSRAGDPQLHFHLLVSNRVQCVDGVWRALDGRNLFPELKTAGMVAQAAMRAELSRDLGVVWGEVSVHGQAEIVGVPTGLMGLHSKRAKQVEAHAKTAILQAEQSLGRVLTPAERAEKFNAAAVQTRAVKSRELHAIEGLGERWRAEAIDAGYDPALWVGDVIGRTHQHPQPGHELEHGQPGQLGLSDGQIVEAALGVLTETKSSWARTDATREIARITPHTDTTGPDVAERIETLTDRLVGSETVVELTINPPTTPGDPVRVDGQSVFERHNSGRFTTLETLEREQRVLDHLETGRDAGIAVARPWDVNDAITARTRTGRPLSDDQQVVVERVTGSGEAIVAVVGPAGTGKSATIGVAADAFERSDIPVRGLAVSARAAEVLRTEAGIDNSDTVAKLLFEQSNPQRPPGPDYQLRAGEVWVVDEASMVSTADFARLSDLARFYQSKIVAVGDYRQLGAVDAGGLYRLIATTGDPAVLDRVWRFEQDWERTTSLQLRAGNPDAIDEYRRHGRIEGGTRQQLVDAAFGEWDFYRSVNESVIVTATDRETVAEFNTRARDHLQQFGQISPTVLTTGDGLEVGVGEEILTLRNDRTLIAGGTHVRNGDRWTVTGHTPNGDLHVERQDRPGATTLPASYLDEGHVGYAYATTVHKAQGVTVDHALTIVDEHTTAESLYVGATRGRQTNRMLAVTEPELTEFDLEIGPQPTPDYVLKTAVARDGAERSATEIWRQQLDQAERLVEHLNQPDMTAPREHAPLAQTAPAGERGPVGELSGDRLRELWRERFDLDKARNEARRVFDRCDRELRDIRAVLDENIGLGAQLKGQLATVGDSLDRFNNQTRYQRYKTRETIAGLERRQADITTEFGTCIDRIEQLTPVLQAAQERIPAARAELDKTRRPLDARIVEIDAVFETDLNARTRRLEHQPDPTLDTREVGSKRPSEPGTELDAWNRTAASVDQHSAAWAGRNPPSGSRDHKIANQSFDHLRTQQRELRRQIDRGYDLGIGR